MISDNERREVAKKLLELPSDVYEVEGQWKTEGISTDCHDQTDYYLIHDVLLECLPAEHMHPCDYEELHARLAELIEPEPERTCQMDKSEFADFAPEYEGLYSCPKCGEETAVLACVNEGGDMEWIKPRFCGFCGAKVVEVVDE